MAANILLPLCILIHCLAGAQAETCDGADESITCIFGCCEDEVYIYCCVGNKYAVLIILVCVGVSLSCLGVCCRQAVIHNQKHAAVNPTTDPAVTGDITDQDADGNEQIAPPPYPGPAINPPNN